MDVQALLDDIRTLTDLELLVLISLIENTHCLLTIDDDFIDDLSSELALIASEVFKLSYAVISLEDSASVEKFGEALLDQNHNHDFGAVNSSSDDVLNPHSRLASVTIRTSSIAPSHATQNNLDSRPVANIVIAKNFNLASRDVQIAALELITRRRIYSRTTVHHVPKTFIFIPLISASTRKIRLNEHLNDRISMSHYHSDGFANLEELETHLPANETPYDSDRQSIRSVSLHRETPTDRHISERIINALREQAKSTAITPEIRRHMQDIIVFLRMARGVDGGVTPFATTQFVNLAKALAPLHGLDFVTPGLVALAVRKVYTHRLVLCQADRERSMQWGSEREAVQDLLNGLTPEAIIDEVLSTIPSPV